jgi:hypothetical protein
MTTTTTEKRWTDIASAQLLGRRIAYVRYMTDAEAKALGWYSRPVVLQLDDGNLIFPSQDDEGNGAGALFTNDDKQPVLPVLGGM